MSIAKLFEPDVSDLELERGYARLGRLAHWWLRPEAIRRAGRPPASPRGDIKKGEVVALLYRSKPSSVLEPGLAIPLRWRPERQTDKRLPRELRALAEEARASWRDHDAQGPISLWLGDECPDLSELQLEMGSAGLLLAASLRATDRNYDFDHLVTASAAIGDGVLKPVEGLESKRAIAAKIGLKSIFVAPGQTRPAEHAELQGAPEFREVPAIPLERQIESMVLALDAPPSWGSVEARCEWYRRHKEERERAEKFFCDHLAADLAAAAREGIPAASPVRSGMETMVSIATGSWESAAFLAHVLNPSRVILLHDTSDRGERYAKQTEAALTRLGGRWKVEREAWVPASDAQFESLVRSAHDRLRSISEREAGRTCVDLTGGTTLMKFALSHAAVHRGFHRTISASMDHAKGGMDVRTLRVISIPHGDGQ